MAKLSFSEKLKSLFGGNKKIDESFFEDLTDALIEGDIGAKTAMEIVDALEDKCKSEKIEGKDILEGDTDPIFKLFKSIISISFYFYITIFWIIIHFVKINISRSFFFIFIIRFFYFLTFIF